MAVLCLAILLFIFEWVRVDVVGIIMMIILPLLGLVTPKEAISGLSSNLNSSDKCIAHYFLDVNAC